MRPLPIVAVLASFALSACSQGPGGGYHQPVGTLVGAAAGGLAGAQFGGGTGQLAATAAGALLGAAVGNDIGGSLDRADAAYGRSSGPGYYAPPPQPTYYSSGAGYAVPTYSGTVTPTIPNPVRVSGVAPGCQRVGNGIWCEQSNGTFRSGY